MKELISTQEKAKRYDEAIERAKSKIKNDKDHVLYEDDVIEIFPELKESGVSEDERIKGAIIEHLRDNNLTEWASWLEKQGNTDKATHEIAENVNEETSAPIAYSKYVDECLNKATKHFFSEGEDTYSIADMFYAGVKCGQSWSEKQSEQKSTDKVEPKDYSSIDPHFFKTTDKVEPKFKVGDWVTNSIETVQITGYDIDYGYQVDYKNNLQHRDTDIIEKEYHHWTLADAKDGDVLAFDNNTIVIFKDLYNKTTFHSYCHIEDDVFSVTTDELPDWWNGEGFVPATKEQRDLLFKKMQEAGYEWDAEKKELKKIHVIDESNAEMDYCFTKMMNGEKVCPIWNEDDERICKCLIEEQKININDLINDKILHQEIVPNTKKMYQERIDWLKSIKERVQPQPKQEWGEEDSKRLQRIIDFLWYNRKGDTDTIYQQEQDIEWLKSLRPQINITDEELEQAKKEAYNNALDKIEYHSGEPTYDDGWHDAIDCIQKNVLRPQTTWKPSGEQMEALLCEVNAWDEDSANGQNLKSLYQDLKKLREE